MLKATDSTEVHNSRLSLSVSEYQPACLVALDTNVGSLDIFTLLRIESNKYKSYILHSENVCSNIA